MTKFITTPHAQERVNRLLARVERNPSGARLIELLQAEPLGSININFDSQLKARGLCHKDGNSARDLMNPEMKPSIPFVRVLMNPSLPDDELVTTLFHELHHALQPSATAPDYVDNPIRYYMVSKRIAEGVTFAQQFIFARQLEECDSQASTAERAQAIKNYSRSELAKIDEIVDDILITRDPKHCGVLFEKLFWLVQNDLKRRYDPRLKILIPDDADVYLFDNPLCYSAELQTLCSAYQKSPGLLPQQQNMLWSETGTEGLLLITALEDHLELPPLNLATPQKKYATAAPLSL